VPKPKKEKKSSNVVGLFATLIKEAYSLL